MHPSFGGVSLLTWNIYNLILQLAKPVVYNWRDCAVLAEDDDRQVTDSYARVVGRRSPDSDIESYRLSGARPKTRVDTAGAFPIRPLATLSTEAQRNTTKPAFGHSSAPIPEGPKKGDVKASPEPQMPAEGPAPKHRPAPTLSPATPQAPRLVDTSPSTQESGTYACSTPVGIRYDLRKRCGSARRVHAD